MTHKTNTPDVDPDVGVKQTSAAEHAVYFHRQNTATNSDYRSVRFTFRLRLSHDLYSQLMIGLRARSSVRRCFFRRRCLRGQQ